MQTTVRRTFLKQTGVGVGALALGAGAVGAVEKSRIAVGIIGTGGMGTHHVKQLAARKDAEIAYVCDVDQKRLQAAAEIVTSATGKEPKAVKDLRQVLDDKAVQAVWIATPDHWHAPAAILALDAGKHVYVEKPCSHNIREGRLMADAVRRSGKLLQVGTQSRSTAVVREAMDRVHGGEIGEVLVAKAWNSQRRGSIGKTKPSDPPPQLDYDLWIGPAPMVAYRANMLPGIWRWWHDFGCGDIGNDGVHDIDVACWGLGVATHPSTVTCLGGKYFFDDDQQWPDTQYAIFEYPSEGAPSGRNKQLIFEQRIWSPYVQEDYENGAAFYGTKGMLVIGHSVGWKLYGEKNKLIDEKTGSADLVAHHTNFLDCVRGDQKQLNADVMAGHLSAALVHLANISVRAGRVLHFDPAKEQFTNDQESNALLSGAIIVTVIGRSHAVFRSCSKNNLAVLPTFTVTNMKAAIRSARSIGLAVAPLTSVRAEVPYDVKARHGCVVSVSSEASEVGLAILRRGNAVDAAIATAFALAVTYPAAGNIGGGGFMMVHMAGPGETVCIEYRETAPAKATKEVYAKLNSTSRGHLTVGVPGTVRGLALAHEKYGTIPWKDLLEPAIDLAEDGFHIDGSMTWSLNYVERQSAKFPELRSVFRRPDTKKWQTGDLLVQKDLANTLRLIADGGPDAFYTGPIAEMIVEEMEAGGGLITKEDLAAYHANVRVPIHANYRDYDVYAAPPPSSGGIVLTEMLNTLENFNLTKRGRHSVATTHELVETMRRAYYDRARYLGDPEFVSIPLTKLTSKEYGRELAHGIAADRATSSADLGREILVAAGEESTTHFSIVDRQGNAVSNTYTLEESFGSHVMVHGAGFILNSELTDFNLHPGQTDRDGEIGTEPNQIAPGKRILSSQTPTIVLSDGKVFLVTGSPGSRTIINTVLHILTNVIDFQMDIREAVDAPRLHHQWMPDVVRIEEGRLTEQTRKQLEAMGHKFESGGRQGDAHSILVDPETGIRFGAADKRISGKASGY